MKKNVLSSFVCRWVGGYLPLRAGGDLGPFLARRVDAHVARCEACAAALAAFEEDRRRIALSAARPAGAGAPLGETFWHDIRRVLRTEGLVGDARGEVRRGEAAPLPPALPLGMVLRGVAAVAALLLAAFVAWPSSSISDRPGGGSLAERPGPGATGGGGPVRPTVVAEPVRLTSRERLAPGAGDDYLTNEVSRPAGDLRAAGWIEESKTLGASAGIEYHIESWSASPGGGGARQPLDF